jgi:HTH-type transcriptional regulator/antitoxin HigA
MVTTLKTIIEHWRYIVPIVKRPENENEKDYESLVSHLDTLLDMVGDDDRYPLAGLVDIISDQISAYEAEHHKPPVAMGVAALRFLMDEHGLTQSDFENEIGSQGVVSEILNGHRKLNLKHIKKLAERFKLSPETFID